MEEIRRVTRTKGRAQASYDKLSKWYDLFVGHIEKRFRDAGLKKLNVQEGEKVLEIGFGTGYCTLTLAKSVGGSGKVYGLDISEGMIKRTTSRLDKAGLTQRVELCCGDAANLPYTNQCFDAIFMSFTLELFDTPDIPVVLEQCRRALKKTGRICIVSMSKEGKTGAMVKLYDWGHERFPNYIDCRPIYLKKTMQESNFIVADEIRMSLLNVPVEIILAENNR